MGFRLAPRSMTLDDLELNKFEFLWISQISDATAAKHMKIGQYWPRLSKINGRLSGIIFSAGSGLFR